MAKRKSLKWVCVSIFLCFSCTKERSLPGAYLSVKFGNQDVVTEWKDLSAARQDDTGMISIDASGYYGEEFSLYLKNITDTGFVTIFDFNNISCYDEGHLKSSRNSKSNININELTKQSIKGTFHIVLEDNETTPNVIEVIGAFSVLRN